MSAVIEAERGPESSAVEWQHIEVLDALEAKQRPWGHRVVTTLSRLRERLDGAGPAPAAQHDENAS